jgi:hypothetical protein
MARRRLFVFLAAVAITFAVGSWNGCTKAVPMDDDDASVS